VSDTNLNDQLEPTSDTNFAEEFGTPFLQYLRDMAIGYSLLGFTNGFCCNLLDSLEPDYDPSPMGQQMLEDLALDR
jgi:hypothetical protein